VLAPACGDVRTEAHGGNNALATIIEPHELETIDEEAYTAMCLTEHPIAGGQTVLGYWEAGQELSNREPTHGGVGWCADVDPFSCLFIIDDECRLTAYNDDNEPVAHWDEYASCWTRYDETTGVIRQDIGPWRLKAELIEIMEGE
jgi:hypothetical protein